MFPQEAAWIEAALADMPDEALGVVLDIGSSDRWFRTVKQPWVEQRVFAPLRRRGTAVRFADLKDRPGVDIVGDLMTAGGLARLRAAGADTVLCCNVLEHVPDAAAFASRLASLVGPAGRLVVTVPHRYPHHNDPIDTMFRPDVAALTALFPDCAVERAMLLRTGSYREEFARRPITLLLRHLLRLPVPFLGWSRWKRSVGKLQYLVRPYEITCMSLIKRPGGQ